MVVSSSELPRILFVSSPEGLGGSNISLGTVLAQLEGRVHRIVAGPSRGDWHDIVSARHLAEERLFLDARSRSDRIRNTVKVARYALQRRAEIAAIHANATTGLFLSSLASRVTGIPVVAWVHDPVTTEFGLRVGPWVRRLTRDVRYAAVTEVAARVAEAFGLASQSEIEIVPNPISFSEVVPNQRVPSDVVRIGYLGSTTSRKGFDILAKVIAATADVDAHWLLFTARSRDEEHPEAWKTIESMDSTRVTVPGPDPDVRNVYAQCDIVFNPSRDESFCRVGAEAMANGIPVIAGDIPPLRSMLGDDQAGLLYPVEDVQAAAEAVRRLVGDPGLRRRLAAAGPERARRYEPGPVVEQLARLYGLDSITSM